VSLRIPPGKDWAFVVAIRIRVQTVAQFLVGLLILFGTIAPARFYLCSKLVEESSCNVSLKSS
jgi:hypothetical protein